MFIRKMQRQNYQIIPQGDMGMYFACMDIYILYILHIHKCKQFCLVQNVYTFPIREREKNSVVSNSLPFKIKAPP